MAKETKDKWQDAAAEGMGSDKEKTPKKEISSITHKKSTNGDHVFTHHHSRPDHHPDETHTKRGDDEMVEHMLANAGQPNEGEDTSDPGSPAANAAAPQAGAAPTPQGSGSAMPVAMGGQ